MANNLSELRKNLGLTQKEFSASLGIPVTTYNGYEKGSRDPRSDFWIEVADKYGVSVEYLMGFTQDTRKQKSAPACSAEAMKVARQYDAAPDSIKGIVNAVLALEFNVTTAPVPVKKTKVIPLFGARFAAGTPETAGDMEWENYETTNQRADFAIHVNGDSMEPVLQDGTIALGVRRFPQAGEVGAFRIDGEFLVKQFVQDSQGNVYLFSVNRDRSDADLVLWHDSDRDLRCYGTILCARTPLPD